MSTNVVRSLVRLDLFEQLDEAGQQQVARALRAYIERQPDVLAILRASVTPVLASWSPAVGGGGR